MKYSEYQLRNTVLDKRTGKEFVIENIMDLEKVKNSEFFEGVPLSASIFKERQDVFRKGEIDGSFYISTSEEEDGLRAKDKYVFVFPVTKNSVLEWKLASNLKKLPTSIDSVNPTISVRFLHEVQNFALKEANLCFE